ncbi:hypothetical protein RchiOBHm_Chr3g0457311 [Rosa chinensis]|uniref:Uncharacterized protein n=1 Tax=Rosa chinensis TaxID=74649 RepID=A0A2P6R7I9_ROSCH|nr:hypothetical protein RchiOBHm_Chr3g0457311 [Rosa chinensis]
MLTRMTRQKIKDFVLGSAMIFVLAACTDVCSNFVLERLAIYISVGSGFKLELRCQDGATFGFRWFFLFDS